MPGAAITSPWKKSRERKRERELKQDAVLAAAAHVFAEYGYHRASLDEVAQLLNVTKPTLYYYFKNKEAMLFACIEHVLDRLDDEAAVAGEEEAMTTGLQRLVAYLRRYARLIDTDFGRCAVRISDTELSDASRKKIRRIKSDIDHKIRELVSDGIADGSIASSDPKVTAFALAGALNSLGHWRNRDADLSEQRIVDEYISLLTNGLIPRKQA
ncbi:MAG: TetR/AcrR family transcriptional regulator [Parvibaculum sp.]|uniref:TetR/AcrR family transcriptional regulator n=1 Tax=Parvibaculum sp. TaxID=2024848 RepID=UPI003C7655F3